MSTAKKTIATMLREAADKLDSKKKDEKNIELAAQGKLDNGQLIATPADEWKEGVEVFVVPDEGEPFPLAAGDYKLDNGATLKVVEDGLVDSIESNEGSPGDGEGGEKKADEQELDAPKIKSVVESVIKEQKFASLEKLEELSNKSNSQEELMIEQTKLITELSEQISELKKPMEMRQEKSKKPKAPSVPPKPINQMSNSERATYLREQYNR